jgi:type IV secretory pathway VirB4 component
MFGNKKEKKADANLEQSKDKDKDKDIKKEKKSDKSDVKKEKKKSKKKSENEQVTFENERQETVFEKHKKNIKDLICTDMNFAISDKYATIGEKYMKNMYVGVTPQSANFASFLHPLYTHGDNDTSVFISPIDSEIAKSDLSTLKTNLEVEFIESQGSTNRMDDMAHKVEEARQWREEVRDSINKMFEVSIVTTLYEDDLRALNNSSDKLRKELGKMDIGLRSATTFQEDAFKSNKPFNVNFIGEIHPFDKRSLACTFPWTSNNINHKDGILIGFNMDNGLPIFKDQFDRSLKNYNMVVFATTGGGKSTYVKMECARSSTLSRVQNICIDIEPEYEEICRTLGGLNVVIAPHTDTIINPFDVVVDIIKNKYTGKTEEKILLSEKINSVTSIIMTMAKGTIDDENYSNITKAIIKEIVKEEYKELGINENPESLYTFEKAIFGEDNRKIVGGRTKKDMPTLSSWYKRLEKHAEVNKEHRTYARFYHYLLKVMKDFTKCNEGDFDCFDGQSTIRLTYDIPFINFNVSQLNEETELPLAQHILTDFIWEQMVKRNSGSHQIRVIVDEAWRMVSYPEALKFLVKMFRRARKKNTSAVVISQQFDEFYKEETKAIIRNADTKLFLPPDDTSVDSIADVFKLTEGERAFLRTCRVKEGLLKVGKASAKIYIDIPDHEKDFIETNQNILAERRKRQQKGLIA